MITDETNTFDIFCNDRKINRLREAFYHHCMANEMGGNPTTEYLCGQWEQFFDAVTKEMIGFNWSE